MRHAQHVEGAVELLLGDLAALDVAEGDDGLADGDALGDGVLRHLGGGLVPDHPVERGHDRRRRLGERAGPLEVRLEPVDRLVGEDARAVREQADRLEERRAHHRDGDVQLERARGPGPRDGGVVADDPRGDHEGGLGDDRVDLAGHDRRAGLQVGDVQFAQAGVRPGAHPPQVVVDLREADRDDPEGTGCLDEGVARALGLEVVECLGDRQAGVRREPGDDLLREALRRVDAGADRGAAERDLGDAGERRLHPLDAEPDLSGVAAELLAERDRGGIHQVGATGLHGVRPEGRLRLERRGEVLERGDEGADEGLGDGDVHRRGEDVVRRLRGVDVVVRVDVRAGDAGRERRQDLVHVHVRRRAAAGLVDVDRELVVVLAADDRVRGPRDRVGHRRVHDAERPVHHGRSPLDPREGDDLRRLEPAARDREVLHRALRLRAVQGVDGHPDLAHRVVLDAEAVGLVGLGGGHVVVVLPVVHGRSGRSTGSVPGRGGRPAGSVPGGVRALVVATGQAWPTTVSMVTSPVARS
ncbi:ribosomal protein S5 [Curtobacterium sp. ER1/6]|nr:ribosomal protein S5 [Curtobacterium sp. ER1/6]